MIGDVDERSNETVKLIEETGGNAVYYQTDVSNKEQAAALIEKTVNRFGRLDHAFNNAGILPPSKPFIKMNGNDFDGTIAVDLKGVFLMMKYEIETMLKFGGEVAFALCHLLGFQLMPRFIMIQEVLLEQNKSLLQKLTPEDFIALTPLIYAHINLYGTFKLNMQERLPIQRSS